MNDKGRKQNKIDQGSSQTFFSNFFCSGSQPNKKTTMHSAEQSKWPVARARPRAKLEREMGGLNRLLIIPVHTCLAVPPALSCHFFFATAVPMEFGYLCLIGVGDDIQKGEACASQKEKIGERFLFISPSSLTRSLSLSLSRTPTPNPVLHKGRSTRRNFSNKVGKEKRKKRGPERSLYELFRSKNKKANSLTRRLFLLRTFSVKMG
ncbi:MAG: hypothetical protein JOS17DRAFT_531692 [Linnemannia elongata]|nr:MAG: hypothetical protein JOS17DRAFT_531692 [Linnemannia elongata]